MLLLIQIFLYIEVSPGITVSPSFNSWEGWVGPGINGGFIIKTAIPADMTVNFALSAGMQSVSDNNDNCSYKSAGINLGLEKSFSNILVSGGACYEVPFGWKFNGYGLTGVNGLWGYYAGGVYKIKENKNFSVNAGLSYHSYLLFKEFMQFRGNIEMLYENRKVTFHAIHPTKPKFSWVITEPIGGFLVGLAGAYAGVYAGMFAANVMQAPSESSTEFFCIWRGAELGYSVGIPIGISLVGKYIEKEKAKKAFLMSLLGSVAGMILADLLVFEMPNNDASPFIWTLPVMPLAGGIIGYRIALGK